MVSSTDLWPFFGTQLTVVGGVLGIYCSHAYPHAAENAQQLLPGGLKGSDLALYCVFKSLKLKVGVLPVLDDDYYEDSTYYCRDRAVGEHLHPFTWSEDYPDQSEGDRNVSTAFVSLT